MIRILSRGAIAAVAMAATIAVCAPSDAAPRTSQMKLDLLGTVDLVAPEAEPEAFFILLSDKDGISPQQREMAERAVKRGAAVATIDTADLMKRQTEGDTEDCHYVLGDLEEMARAMQRRLEMKKWVWPVIIGLGDDGGTLAYLSIAQAPDNTFAGAVSLGLKSTFESKKVFCAGAPDVAHQGRSFTYAPMTEIPGKWTLITADQPTAEQKKFLDASDGTASVVEPKSDDARFDAAIDAALEISKDAAKVLADLPLVEIPAEGDGPPKALFVLISGDGGWRDIDKQIGEFLSQHGIAVVGVDSLRYFWSEKKPEQIADDMSLVIARYTDKWKVSRTGIGGYSMGADVLPMAWEHFKPQVQAKISRVVLLGIEPTAALQVTVGGWLGINSEGEKDLRPFLKAMPRDKVMCFYGAEEKTGGGTACVLPELDGTKRFERPGGHHFDGDYEAVARIILEELESVPVTSGGKEAEQVSRPPGAEGVR